MKINFNPNATAVKDINFVSIRMSLYQNNEYDIVKSHIVNGTTISLDTEKDKVFRLRKSPDMVDISEWDDFCKTNPIEGFAKDSNYGEYPEIISSYNGKFEFMTNLEKVDDNDFDPLKEEYDYRLVRHIFLYKSDFINRINRITNHTIRDYYIHSKYLGRYLEEELKHYPENEYVYILDTFNRYGKAFSGNVFIRRAYACPIDAYDTISRKEYYYLGTQIVMRYPHSRFENSINGLFTILNNGKCKYEYQTMERMSGDHDKYTLITVFDSAVTKAGEKKPIFLKGTSVSKTHKFNLHASITGYWDKWYDEYTDDVITVSSIEDIKDLMDNFCQDCIKKFEDVRTGVGVQAIGDPNSVEISINGIYSSTDPIDLSEIKFFIRNYGHANVLSTLSISVGRGNMDRNIAGRIFAEKIGDNKEYDITGINISKFDNNDREYRISNDNLVITKKDVVVINKEYYQNVHLTIDIFIRKANKLIMELIRLISNGEASDYITKKYLTDFEEIKSSYIGEIPSLDTVISRHYEDVM